MEHYEQCDDQIEVDSECVCDELNSKYEEERIDIEIEDCLLELSRQDDTCEFCRGFVVEDKCTLCKAMQMHL